MNERIKELRKEYLKLTMEKFGERLGVGKTAISNIENGNRNVTDQMFKSICREFNVSEDWLRDGTGKPFVVPEDETAAIITDILIDPDDEVYRMILNIAKIYQQLNPDAKKVLRDFCSQLAENTKNRKD